MLPGMELMGCTGLAVPPTVMEHVVKVESSFNPYAIGVVGGRLARQPRNLPEALSTARMLEERGYNFSLGLAQVNRHNLARQGLDSYEKAFAVCPNLQAGSRILAECYSRSGSDWGKAFSCYYSGNFTTGYRHGYVQKVFASWQRQASSDTAAAIPVIDRYGTAKRRPSAVRAAATGAASSLVARRIEEAKAARASAQRTASLAAAEVQPAPAAVRAMPAPAAPVVTPAIAQASAEAPVTVQAYHQNTTSAPQAPQVVQTSGRDDAFVF
ncbi:transglycosylase SLT domain-containing protein [Pseudoxanthomonas sp. LH2527]|uniref:lytic transglycosylase domain-containing protein n=1 Tax=Pseudoxanthomonas sp. LH2527 TaxID=2923249 RepID=UPI001F1360CD|nr:lytic transglycosylase domain-containing protein [Pseudoxanthomonas sp. LH2527]MCH6482404.1 transglycosylase SLT domain-containing protein [Pseudoxanthomonas sp. LH2527]